MWDPYRVLDVYPDSTCVGIAISTDRRCRWSFHSEQFSAAQRATAVRHLQSMARMHPSMITSSSLYALAWNTLCKKNHQWQANAVVNEWQARINDYLHERSIEEVRHPHNEPDDAQNQQNGIPKDEGASKQAVKELCQALESVTATLKTTQTRCSELTESNDTLHQQREEDRAANSQKVDNLKQQLRERNANFERDRADSSKAIEGLKNHNARLTKTETAHSLEIGSLKAEVRDRNKALDERTSTSRDEADGLRQQLQVSREEVTSLRTAKAEEADRARSSELEADDMRLQLRESNTRYEALDAERLREADRARLSDQKAEDMRRQLQESNTRYQTLKAERLREADRARSSELEAEDVRRQLQKSNTRCQGLDQEYKASKEESAGRIARLRELLAEREVGGSRRGWGGETYARKTADVDEQDQLSSLQLQNVKKGLFAVISMQPPRILVRKISKIMRTASTPYVQSAA